MKRQAYSIMAAALLLASGALLTTACGNEDTAIDNPISTVGSGQTIQFTATLAPKGDDGGQTRTITTGKDANDKEILNVAWEVGEKISVIYSQLPTVGYEAMLTTATVTAVDPTTGTATISAPIEDPKDGTKVTFVYPATLKPSLFVSPESILLSQHGNLTARTTPNVSIDDISTNFDYATGSGTLSVAAGTAVVSSKVTMTNEVCICKFRFEFDDGTGSGTGMGGIEAPSYTPITINDGDGHTYTIVSDKPDDSTSATSGSYRGFRSTDDIYVALLPISGKTVTFSATRKGSTDTYTCTKTNVTLEKGKFYRNLGTITLVRE